MAASSSPASTMGFIGNLDPTVVEESNARFERRREKYKKAIDEATEPAKELIKSATDCSSVGGCIAGRVALSVCQPEIASIVNPLLGLAQGPALNAKRRYVNPLLDKGVEKSAESSKKSVDLCC